MMPAHKAITSGMSLLSAARDVVTVPAKSARGTAYCSTIRFRVGASFEPKSCRRAATKPSRNVTTIGRSALKIMSSMAVSLASSYPEMLFGWGSERCGDRIHFPVSHGNRAEHFAMDIGIHRCRWLANCLAYGHDAVAGDLLGGAVAISKQALSCICLRKPSFLRSTNSVRLFLTISDRKLERRAGKDLPLGRRNTGSV